MLSQKWRAGVNVFKRFNMRAWIYFWRARFKRFTALALCLRHDMPDAGWKIAGSKSARRCEGARVGFQYCGAPGRNFGWQR